MCLGSKFYQTMCHLFPLPPGMSNILVWLSLVVFAFPVVLRLLRLSIRLSSSAPCQMHAPTAVPWREFVPGLRSHPQTVRMDSHAGSQLVQGSSSTSCREG